MDRSGAVGLGEGDGEDVHRADRGPRGVQRTEGFLVWIDAVCREDDELVHASRLPGADQVVEHAV